MTRAPAERRFEELATTCGPRVLAYLARRTSPREDAADVYQEVLTTTWRKVHTAPEAADEAVAWMLAIARRTLANHRRASGRRLAATDRLRDELLASAPEREGVGGDDRVDDVRSALAGLGEDDREVLLLTYWEGLSSDQVAAVVGAGAATTRKRLQRARERLAAALRAHDAVPVAAAGASGRAPRG
jgi:RNA polymerase sigma-70 factor (ECF subfamily)